MATVIKRIEKDFLLKVLYDERIPVINIKDRTQYLFRLEKPARGQMFFKCDRPVKGLKENKILELMFDYQGKIIMFSVKVSSIKGDLIITEEPEFLYRNLVRSFFRVSAPPDLLAQFSFLGNRYSLSYPRVTEYENDDFGELAASLELRNLRSIIEHIEKWISSFASGQKIVIFKDAELPLHCMMEEKIISETGKALFLPSSQGSYPIEDPYPQKRIVTEEIFKRYLESIGIDRAYLEKTCARFIRNKFEEGIFSDLWVPIRFHEYVIGYIHSWINEKEKAPFNYRILDNLYQFSKILAMSFKINGYFEYGKLKNESFDSKIIDISASGILFSYPNSSLTSALLPDSELVIRLNAPHRAVNTKAKIVRLYRDNIHRYFGCRFIDLEQEDFSFLFEYIYGTTFTCSNAIYFSGQV
jgi:hypothetical protein